MKMKPLYSSKLGALVLYIGFIISGCTTSRQAPHAEWTRDDIVGLTIELVDPVRVEWMKFSGDGYAAITIGEKDGWITNPLFQWRLANRRLQILDGQKVFEELTLISRDSSLIVARKRSGKIARYKILEKRGAS